MPALEQFLPGLAVALVAMVLVWFALGTQLNIRRGHRILRWLQDGLPMLGRRTTFRWLGSSVAELRIANAEAPFRAAQVMVVLEPRDLGLLWGFARRRGRRDFVLLRLDLARAPRLRADLVDPEAWTARDRRAGEEPPERVTQWTDGAGRLVEVAHDGAADADIGTLRDAWTRISASGRPWRISIRQTVPHVEVHLVPGELAHVSSRPLFEDVRRLASEVTPGR